ncbi:Beta-1,3-glucosyltransferase [Enterococcus faecalis FL2]|uniref:glycosyltransferase family 2 protein n=1 Tax=Enterococcus TaxID=1350 RepID=UPI00045A1D08|nr:glycosyltransferase family 2 protein [Enterococcus faecalis]EHS2295441.1 glycosyltransferase family 2 protein [Enterococcus faecalis]KAJ60711.1 Beta-1,3-glucosyltransferase [Enterococcus faecalis FL2]
MPEISIIVPVYNVEKYLEKCVKTILSQSFTNFELLLVDDGSTDTSGVICDKLKELDSRIKVIHKENGGLSSARNAGIDIAKGEYLTFIDSDDFISDRMIEYLYKNIKNEHADLSITGVESIYSGKEPEVTKSEIFILDQKEAIEMILIGKKIPVYAVAKLYKKTIFKELRFPVGKAHEDVYIIMDVLKQCNKVVADTSKQYFYVHRKGSITSAKFSTRDLDSIDSWEQVYKVIQNIMPEYKDLAFKRVCAANFYVLDKIMKSDSENDYSEVTKKIIKFLKENQKFIYANPYFTKNRKLGLTFLKIHPIFYKPFPKLQQKYLRKINQ